MLLQQYRKYKAKKERRRAILARNIRFRKLMTRLFDGVYSPLLKDAFNESGKFERYEKLERHLSSIWGKDLCLKVIGTEKQIVLSRRRFLRHDEDYEYTLELTDKDIDDIMFKRGINAHSTVINVASISNERVSWETDMVLPNGKNDFIMVVWDEIMDLLETVINDKLAACDTKYKSVRNQQIQAAMKME